MEKRRLKVGETEEISFKTCSDGGFRWQVKYDPDYVEIQQYTKPSGKGIGGATLSEFHIKAKTRGKFSIDFYHCNPWLGHESSTEHKTIDFEVEE